MNYTVCGLSDLGTEGKRANCVLSLLDPEWPEISIDGFVSKRLTLRFHDVLEAAPGFVPPGPEHADEIIRFADSLKNTGDGPCHLLIHCHAGLSRSPAAMLLVLAKLEPEADEAALFGRLRGIRPDSWPNSLLVRLGDDALGRGGRLMEALRDHYGHQVRRQPEFIRWMTRLRRVSELEMAR
ncbi:MAG TPA: protein-tyrosine-phosphatase [Bosea sp. (in: a-proteobacteria)]